MKKFLFLLVMFAAFICSSQTVTNITTNIKLAAGNSPGQLMRLVNGVFSNSDDIAPTNQPVSNLWIKFDMQSPVIVNQIIWNQGYARYMGDFKVQGSKDGSNWVDLSGNFQLGNTTPQKLSFSNSTQYHYYRLLGVTGSTSGVYWWEVQFNASITPPIPPNPNPIPPALDSTWLISTMRKVANEEINKQDSLMFNNGDIKYDTMRISNNPKVKYKLEKF